MVSCACNKNSRFTSSRSFKLLALFFLATAVFAFLVNTVVRTLSLSLLQLSENHTSASQCVLDDPTFPEKSYRQRCFHTDAAPKPRPLIAIMVAVTTRGVGFNQPSDLVLFKYMLPSLWRTAECGYDYRLVVGYDEGDPFYDTPAGLKTIQDWVERCQRCVPASVRLGVGVDFVRVKNDLGKPGPVFNKMAEAAYDLGADYFYRVNDDTEFLQPWTTPFIQVLEEFGPPYGVVGPLCNQGNTLILTHDFTHRTHMEIFDRLYYPTELSDWWMDDWISLVYGEARTRKMDSVEVIHHTQQTRYAVDYEHHKSLQPLIDEGRQKIEAWQTAYELKEKRDD